MRKSLYYYFLSILLLIAPTTGWARGKIVDYRVSGSVGQVRVVMEMDSAFSYKTFTLDNPDRLVLDLDGVHWKAEQQQVSQPGIKQVRHGPRGNSGTRVVIDLTGKGRLRKHFTLLPDTVNGNYRLVAEVAMETKTQAEAPLSVSTPAATPAPHKQETNLAVVLPAKPSDSSYTVISSKDIPKPAPPIPAMKIKVEETPASVEQVIKYGDWHDLEPASSGSLAVPTPVRKPSGIPNMARTGVFKPLIVIDPGHGGVDPGTIGPAGTWEKNVTLSNANLLKQILEQSGKYRVHLTRSGDYFVPLHDRVKRAHEYQGDLFISLHADAHPDPKTRGLSVYTISEQAAEREAAVLAQRASKEQVIRGVDLSRSSNEVANVLIDLMQRDTTNTSAGFAQLVAEELGKDTKLLRNTHRFAGYRVLTGADIPSVLIELGYLSNSEEEQLLASKPYQQKLTKAIKRAIDRHFKGRRLE